MTLYSNRMLVVVSDSDGTERVFTDARASIAISQNMEDPIAYMHMRSFAEGNSFSESIRDEIAEAVARGKAIHG